MLARVRHDLRHGSRLLLKTPGFTIVAVLSIAVGIGANAAMLSLADALALRALRVPRSDEVIDVTTVMPQDRDHSSASGAAGPVAITSTCTIDRRHLPA